MTTELVVTAEYMFKEFVEIITQSRYSFIIFMIPHDSKRQYPRALEIMIIYA